MKKIKTWLKEHKKEIIVGVVATGVTATYFLIKQKKISLQGGLRLTMNISNRPEDTSEGPYDYVSYKDYNRLANHINATYYNPNIKVSELGKLGDVLKNLVDEEAIVTCVTSYYKEYNE